MTKRNIQSSDLPSSVVSAASAVAQGVINNVVTVGHSYTDPLIPTNFSLQQRFTAKLASLLGSHEENYGVAGSQLYADGRTLGVYLHSRRSWAAYSQFGSGGPTGPYLPGAQVGLIFLGINEPITSSFISSGFPEVVSGLEALIDRMEAGGYFDCTNTGQTSPLPWTFTTGSGGSAWTSTTGPDGVNACYKSVANGNVWTITLPSDFPGGIVKISGQIPASGGGASHAVTVDGTSVGTWNTTTNAAGAAVYTGFYTPSLSAGSHVISGTLSSVGVSGEFVQGASFPSNISTPLILVANCPRLPGDIAGEGANANNRSDANVATINAQIASVVSSYGPNVVLWNADAVLNKTPAYFSPNDRVHPTAQAAALLAESAYQIIIDNLALVPSPAMVLGWSGDGFQRFRMQEGGPQGSSGTATLSGGIVVQATRAVTASSRIYLSPQDNNTTGSLRVSARTSGSSFTITSSNSADSGVVAWEIHEPINLGTAGAPTGA